MRDVFVRAHDGVLLAYLELGEGRPLVFVHGFTGTAAQLVDEGPARALAAAGFRAILPDLRGHGNSAAPRDPSAWPPDVLADDGLALVEALGLDDYDLAGYSLGGRVVLRMLARGARPRRAIIAGQGRAAAEADGPNTAAFRERLEAIISGGELDPPAQWIVDHGFDPLALLHLLGTYVTTPDDVLAAIPVPTLVLTGDDDRARLTAPALAAALGDGRFRAVPGDHFAAMVGPELAVEMVEFLTSDLAEPTRRRESSSFVELIPAAIDRFGARVHAVPADRWSAPTPCSEWSIRDLVAHMVFEHRWAPHVLAGETMDAVGEQYDGDLVGDDPVRAWDEAAALSRPAWASGAAQVHTSFGWLSVQEYAVQMLVDLTVHEWDLARGAGLDEHLDPEAVGEALAYIASGPIMLTGPGLFASAVEPRTDDPQDLLLALVGRRV